MNKWPETVDETEDDDAFTWNEPPSGEGGTEGRGFTPDKHNLLRDLETMENGMSRNAAGREEVESSQSSGTTGILQSMLCSCCSIEAGRKYYAEANDVSILNHLLQAMVSPIYLKDANASFLMGSSETVELYGPIWIVLTFVLVLIAAGNVWRYFHQEPTDIHLIWIATVLLFGYIILSSVMICYFGRKLFPSSASFPHALCISGYALAAFVPMSMLSAIPVIGLSWALLALSAMSSSIFLLHPRGGLASTRTEEDDELRDDEGFNLFTNAFVVYPVITWQIALALAVKFLFFH